MNTAAVTGGRDHWPSLAELEFLASEIRARAIAVLRDGDCPTGVDRTARGYIKARKVCGVDKWPAKWKTFGTRAGPIRNRDMLDGRMANYVAHIPDRPPVRVLFAFAGNTGTADCTDAAVERGIPIVNVEPVAEPRIWNRHWTKSVGPPPGPSIYVGRGSPLGNPYRLELKIGETRRAGYDRIMAHYRAHLWAKIEERDANVLRVLESLTPDHFIVCSCWPRHCHAEVIVRAWRYLRKTPP